MSNLTLIPYQETEIFFDEHAEPWLTQKQIARLLDIRVQNVNRILKNASGDLGGVPVTCHYIPKVDC